MFIGCRVGKVGLLAALADGGAQQPFEEAYDDLLDVELHPLQFRELCAHVAYRSTLATRTPKYITAQGQPHLVYQMPLGGLSAKPMFEDWDSRTYAHYLAHYVGEDVEHLYAPPDKVMTWLHTPEKAPRFMDFKEYPVLPKEPTDQPWGS
jgi:hypothetical protein